MAIITITSIFPENSIFVLEQEPTEIMHCGYENHFDNGDNTIPAYTDILMSADINFLNEEVEITD